MVNIEILKFHNRTGRAPIVRPLVKAARLYDIRRQLCAVNRSLRFPDPELDKVALAE